MKKFNALRREVDYELYIIWRAYPANTPNKVRLKNALYHIAKLVGRQSKTKSTTKFLFVPLESVACVSRSLCPIADLFV